MLFCPAMKRLLLSLALLGTMVPASAQHCRQPGRDAAGGETDIAYRPLTSDTQCRTFSTIGIS